MAIKMLDIFNAKNKNFYKKSNIKVKWTGTYPNLCHGSWEIKINDVLLKEKNPDKYEYKRFLSQNMGTEGTYSRWYFDENYSVVFEDYYDSGDYKNDWYQSCKGKKMLKLLNDNGVNLSENDLKILYQKISDEDWRSSSCGGCI